MKERILITGGAGFIGSNIAQHLYKLGHEITILDNLSPQIHGKNHEDSFLYQSVRDISNFIKGDVREMSDWEKALRNQTIIIHLAAETGTGQSMYEIEKYSSVNIGGTSLLLDLLANKKNNIKKLIIASSRAIYGEGKYYCPDHKEVFPKTRSESDLRNHIFYCRCPKCNKKVKVMATDEESRINPQSVYGITKQTQEQLVHIVCKSLKIPSVALRYQNVYGPGQSLSNPYTGILSIFSTLIKNNSPINIFEDGLESRDFVYIDDVVNITTSCIENENSNYNSLNVGSGSPTTVLQVAEKLKKLYESDIEIKIGGNYRLGDIRHNYADLVKVKANLNVNSFIQFEQGIEHFVKWVNTQEIQKNTFSNSLLELKKRNLFK